VLTRIIHTPSGVPIHEQSLLRKRRLSRQFS
jgi:hypothetical protein